jgi:F-type H+-transporting ATPase subunit gamma
MLTYKEYNLKLARLRNTRKLTQTMKMVSANKFRKAQAAQQQADRYGEEYRKILGRLLGKADVAEHPLLRVRPEIRSTWVVVCTSDRGLCGGFNNGLCRFLLNWLETEIPRRTEPPRLSFWGRRGVVYFQDRFPGSKVYPESGPRPMFADALQIGHDLQSAFLEGVADDVYVAYNEFETPLRQVPTVKRLLPMDPVGPNGGTTGSDLIFEPAAEELMWPMLSRFLNLRIQAAMLNTAAGEHAARMRAMDSATRNADQVIEETQLLRNRARQSTITRELIEIVAGAEALKS